MSARRISSRSRKEVDYASLDRNFEDDDDFATTSAPPPSKKNKSSDQNQAKDVKRVVKKDDALKANVKDTKSEQRTSRLPLDQKLFERDLQAALELSKAVTATVFTAGTDQSYGTSVNVTDNKLSPVMISSSPSLPAKINQKDDEDVYSLSCSSSDDDDDDDYKSSGSNDSDCIKNKSKKKSPAVDVSSKSVSAPPRKGKVTKAKTTSAPSKSVNQVSVQPSVAVKSSSSPASSFVRPVASVSSNSSKSAVSLSMVTSPSSGLRLGLSRNVKVKPLHRSLHVSA